MSENKLNKRDLTITVDLQLPLTLYQIKSYLNVFRLPRGANPLSFDEGRILMNGLAKLNTTNYDYDKLQVYVEIADAAVKSVNPNIQYISEIFEHKLGQLIALSSSTSNISSLTPNEQIIVKAMRKANKISDTDMTVIEALVGISRRD